MLAEPVATIPAGMLYEPKWDGWRCVCFVRGGVARLYSRRGTELTGDFPEIVVGCAEQLPANCTVDGEIVVLQGNRLEYTALARRHASGARADRLAAQRDALRARLAPVRPSRGAEVVTRLRRVAHL